MNVKELLEGGVSVENVTASNDRNSRSIMFTGGGTTGHVMVNISLIPLFLEAGWKVSYIGSKGIEKKLISEINNVDYYEISVGKLRRYFDIDNVKDIFSVIKGCKQAIRVMQHTSPNVLFSKGGYVSFPAVYAAHHCQIPVIIHESDLSPGLSNKLSMRYATTVCTTFPSTREYIHRNVEVIDCGPIIRSDLLSGKRERGKRICCFENNKPTLLVMGGSSGAETINRAVRQQLNGLLPHFNIIHLCGFGNIDNSLHVGGYRQFDYVGSELPDLLALSDIAISRAGSNSIFELLSICKPMLLIPLPTSSSRGDQILNANYFEDLGFAMVLRNDNCDMLTLCALRLYQNRLLYTQRMRESPIIKTGSLKFLAKLIVDRSLSNNH